MELLDGKDFKYVCVVCDFYSNNVTLYNRHLLTQKHAKNEVKERKANGLKIVQEYSCGCCHYFTHIKSSYTKHMESQKHYKNMHSYNSQKSTNEPIVIGNPKEVEPEIKRTIPEESMDIVNIVKVNPDTVMRLLMENRELQQRLMHMIFEQNEKQEKIESLVMLQGEKLDEISKKEFNNNTYNSTNNINIFLQEKCKDAMNMSDFVNSLDYSIESLQDVGMNGYVNGITKLFTDKLKEIDVYERPIHCTDLKREILYIKDDDKWEKDMENEKMKKIIDKVGFNNMKTMLEWKRLHPESNILDTDEFNFYMSIMRESMNLEQRKDEKILSNICQNVHISRHMLKDL